MVCQKSRPQRKFGFFKMC